MIRSGTSIGANYREANDALGKNDFIMRLRIARKEAKETVYWLQSFEVFEGNDKEELQWLADESQQYVAILSSIINNTKKKSLNA
jgi:four helix bundle protein